MKKLIVSLVILAAGRANAVPGNWGLTCVANKGTKKEIKINAGAYFVDGTETGFPSQVNVKFPSKVVDAKNDDGTLAGLTIISHPIDRVLAVKYSDEKVQFEIWALPAKIQLDKNANEYEGHLTFKGSGYAYGENEGYHELKFNCSYNYDSGSAG